MLDPSVLARSMQAASLIIPITIFTVGGAYVGSLLDARVHSELGLFFLFGAGGGFALGIWQLFRGLARLQETDDDSPPDSP